ncbi:MAG: UDP-N-acetylglucosamine 2-epimerase (non-hydrolyzing), partial [Gammaproteobacteria bacterium]|nr:UDP-N-acetylglucosamine 2-epimerase (non-hydrolyzing) [Gammaproteobacteria bacterium]
MKINTLCIFGTCPEAIKMVPVIKCLDLDPRFYNQVGVLEQQLDKMQSVLDLYNIRPDHRWNMMMVNQDVSRLTARILLILSDYFEKNRPDYVLVVGDTVTALAAALAAYYFHIPIGHIEAGLRSGDHYLPRSQEANRKLVGHLANVHFASTFSARHNLLREGIASDVIYVTGSTVMDALFDTLTHIRLHSDLQVQLREQFSYLSPLRKMILVTGPKCANGEQRLRNICEALRAIAQKFPEIDIVYPVDPSAQPAVHAYLAEIKTVFLIDPTDYLAFVYLMQTCYLVITDSGGIQEEAPSLGKPVLLMREKTERPEALEAGTVILVGNEVDKIVFETTRLL